MSNSVNIWTLFGNDATFLAKRFNNCLTCFCAVKAIKCSICADDLSCCIKDDKSWKVMALADFKVIDIVCWSYLHGAGTKCRINMLIPHDRDHAIYKWYLDRSSNEVLVALILWMNGNSCITKHCLCSSCCNNDCICTIAISNGD
ncbi:unannotated protein [freshwater metagenome]|uniref:Unannotated protein n=1 Tax=freshwater metagenome TaxID=449393 RepID=A0A6J6KMJ9_9ZZZZ